MKNEEIDQDKAPSVSQVLSKNAPFTQQIAFEKESGEQIVLVVPSPMEYLELDGIVYDRLDENRYKERIAVPEQSDEAEGSNDEIA